MIYSNLVVINTIKFYSLYANFVIILDASKSFSTKNTMPRQCVALYFLYLLFSLLRGGVLWFDRDGATDVQVGLREGNLNAVLVQDSINVFLDEGNVSHL